MKTSYRLLLLLSFLFLMINCARTGRPDGGPKDEEAPLFVTANPPYESTNFDEVEIRIEFDEYVTLKDLNKQLVVSPPMKNPPLITPQGTPSDFIDIEIIDTLKANTTYILNFGNAVQDNNEGNQLENFKYVFSTGSYIDSLTTFGTIKDAELLETPRSVNVLMYRIDSTFNDSIIYKRKPDYVTSTLDTTNYNFTNLRKGNYLLLALKEPLNDYIFNSKTDKIGFYKDTIQLPKDSIIPNSIVLFNEEQPYEFARGKETAKGKIEFGFYGDAKDMKINLLSDVPEDFKSIAKFDSKKDTLNYWYTPIERDSLNFIVANNDVLDTITVRLRKKNIDSLIIESSIRNILNLRDTFYINSNTPIVTIDSTKINLFDKDTLAVKYKIIPSIKENKIAFVFDKKPEDKYKFSFLPKAFTDIYEVANDSLAYYFVTNELEDYGRITLNVNNINSKNVIIELLSGQNQDEIVERRFINSSAQLVFDLLEPIKYTVRAIIDENGNNKWDTGNYLKKQQPEVILYNEAINNYALRANYFVEEIFIIN
ncbi:Ig-like domain-containing protein [Polaribacter dokdonensis]|uniref:Ig-like domain-containing protein n=2 Tax=Polaribacter dokdonensis DSW-5 TaxID=1300348 RepID=A0A1H5FCL5_9FLAO|nr:Ig-like domain-containing protein [Polaribacter dokdonensis]SEE01109.1 Ig-like domain-containing protein [Polaribacter dokdonensis DSW-5]